MPNSERPAATPPDASIPKTPTRIRGLDDILAGGFPVGRISLICGGPGTGKTSLSVEFLCRCAASGESGVLVSFEERAEDLHANAAAMGMDTRDLEAAGRFKIIHAAIPRHMVGRPHVVDRRAAGSGWNAFRNAPPPAAED